MEIYYLFLIGIIVLFAISDLVVGVSNDAVNFLNSAIGAKAAPFWIIMVVACLGVLIGATFSSGMMEIARNGIFDPTKFQFSEIMIIFLAVMLTDVILLDTFNSLGMPTSTTVSIVFELLGGAVAISLIKISNSGESYGMIAEYINTEKALLIISGILLSVVVAFTFGSIIQWITRLIFSFNFEKSFKYGGAIFGGFSITSITYFLLIKGAKGASFMKPEYVDFIHNNTFLIILYSFAIWTVLLQLLNWIFKFNILRFCVLVGTFSLAMAFAGNDLVNFIGVPLASMSAYSEYTASGMNEQLLMTSLSGKVSTPTLFLLIAGMVMVVTLWLSKKARSVTATSLNLSNQNSDSEQFGSSLFARSIVRGAIKLNNAIELVLPQKVINGIQKQFTVPVIHSRSADNPSFDMLRATINLVVASILIAIGTSFKLPLSTTYVTFMVAMGTSLADGAWGRESAVYRITGVIAVIGGWFITAFAAFTLCAIVATLIFYGGAYAVFIILAIIIYVVIKSKQSHSKKLKEKEELNLKHAQSEELGVTASCEKNIQITLTKTNDLLIQTLDGLNEEDRRLLRNAKKGIAELNFEVKEYKDNLSYTIRKMNEISLEASHYYVQMLDYIREVAHCLTYINNPVYDHVNNNHKPLHLHQITEVSEIKSHLSVLINEAIDEIKNHDFSKLDEVISMESEIVELIESVRKKQIKRIKRAEVNTRNSMLYMGLLHELKSLSLHIVNILKSHRDFVTKRIDNIEM
jgi:phosphate/sulfate permease